MQVLDSIPNSGPAPHRERMILKLVKALNLDSGTK